ncbi:MAG: hypothetical protein LBJ08_06295 [Bifidobacteriaceae bacterium]|nr:hypothetical protein [Bifidobacteriaceae bacterium]
MVSQSMKRCAVVPVVACALLAVVVACSDTSEPPGGARAVFDDTTGTIALPLDDFGMSREEAEIVSVAGQLQLDQCLESHGGDRRLTVAQLRDALDFRIEPNWRYGYWNTPIVEERVDELVGGGQGGQTNEQVSAGLGTVDAPSGEALGLCVSLAATMLTPITTEMLSDDAFPLVTAAMNARSDAEEDPQWDAAVKDWQECVRKAGWEVDPEYDRGVRYEGLDDEMARSATVADARCADRLGTVQAMAGVHARHQELYIAENREELLKVKKQAEDRVREAKRVLADAGLGENEGDEENP